MHTVVARRDAREGGAAAEKHLPCANQTLALFMLITHTPKHQGHREANQASPKIANSLTHPIEYRFTVCFETDIFVRRQVVLKFFRK